ncbi:3'(2'),5'-bisphosphate nucleotidase CysQ [Pseudoroseicyclus aestuarii]|uniref:Myo-inositol-1(Or 4)-monophosphatase n=1 Tax=Pseudoroseicyclus aestuarii TaxID=1795041 RepID=A0A318STF6_9RHOB|nr:3'(2'),5'-bisphosphate nucleotidase CysQ [Pseudoroseicyclus aestuarii]PYE84645.1 myo-inositol-1(or 4)-monophosphatase [Pseudoroseicyclus aestuarii]
MQATDAAADRDLLVEAVQAAGALAKGFSDPVAWDKPGAAGPVSEADLASNALLRERLTAARPDYGWLSEESEDDPARLAARRVFVVDPIDGTRAYLAGQADWGVSVAVAEDGVPLAAAVVMPVRGLIYAAARGCGATLNGDAIAVGLEEDLGGSRVLASGLAQNPAQWKGGVRPAFRRHFRSSLAYRMCLVAEGRFDAMIAVRPSWEWDIAAGALIVAEAGGVVTDRGGAPLRFNGARPLLNGVIAAGAPLHRQLADALVPEQPPVAAAPPA